MKKNVTRRFDSKVAKKGVRTTTLRLESLESRELLSVAPGGEFLAADNANIRGFISGPFTVAEARAAYEASAATPNYDVVDLADALPNVVEAAPAETTVVDAQPTPEANSLSLNIAAATPVAGVSGPGEPSIYYDADKSDFNTEDDLMCWAATASNMLWHTGWASVTNAQNEQEFFDTYFVNSWPDAGGNAQNGISWFLTDKSYSGGSTSARASAGYYSQLMGQYGESARDYVSVYSQSDSLKSLSTSLTSGDAVGLSVDIFNSQGNGHAITCWGYAVNASYSATDPRYYAGLYITDSDDEKSGKNDDELNERKLVYVGLEWRDNLQTSSSGEDVGGYLLNNYNARTGDDRYYLTGFQTLKQRPEKYASVLDVEPISTVVTTADDVYDVLDGKISLREALVYAHPGDTITFADSLKGKTIKLDSERGELMIDKSITIDASNLWNATTSAPGLTISGEGATRILKTNWGVKDVKISRVTLTKGFIEGSGGAIYNYGATLSLDSCVICNNEANYGGGFYSAYGDATLTNCIVANNTARYYGGGAYVSSGASYTDATTLVNCTVTNNAAQYYGGGFYVSSNAALNAYNSIVCGNSSARSGADVYLYNSTSATNARGTLSSFTDWTSGANNLTYDASKPLFTDATSGNYTLASNSQAINKGNDLYVRTTVDLAGNKRISGEKVDLGAYEYQFNGDLEALATPADVAYAATYGSINVSWGNVQNAIGYRLAYRTTDGSYTTVDLPSNTTSYSLTGLTLGETYYLEVAALGDGVSRRTSYYSPETPVYVPTFIVVTGVGEVVDANDGVVTLREAFNSAKDGDTITFASSLKGKTITLNSYLYANKSVTIDALSLYTASTNTPGVTISGGDSRYIMWIRGNYSVVLKGLKFTECQVGCGDGAILVEGGDLVVEDCLFSDINANFSQSGNVIFVNSAATLTAKSTVITGNVCAGIRVEGKVSLTDCNIEDNASTGIHVNTVGEASLTNCNIVGNDGDGFKVRDNGRAALSNCNIINNDGYGILAQGVYVSATSCKISGNVQTGVNLDVGEASLMTCEIDGNGSMGIFVSKNCVLTATNCLISRNSANYGAGLYLYYGNAILYNCTIVNNTVNYGGGVYLSGTVVLNAYNTIIANNSATYSGGDVYIPSKSGPIANAYNVLSSYANWTSGANNLTYDATQPLFTNAESGDYTLAEGSQAIDKGNNQYVTTDVDLAGNARVSGSAVDLGAYEYQTEPTSYVQLAAPTNARETGKAATTVTVAWNAAANATGYRLAWKNQTASTYSYVTLGATTTSYQLIGLNNGATYEWKVQALGDGSDYADSVYTTARIVAPLRKLATPVVSYDADQTSITVSWDAVPNVSSYRVMYQPSGGAFKTVSVVASKTSYKISGLTPGETYSIKVAAFGDGTNYSSSDYSPLTPVTTQGATPTPDPNQLAAPTNARETAKAATTITVAWNAVENASGYRLAWKKQTDSAYSYVTLGASSISCRLTGLDNGAVYEWKVQALGDGGDYVDSEYTSARIAAPLRKLATPIVSYDADQTSITVSWDAVPNVSSYRVMYQPSGGAFKTVAVVASKTSYNITGLTPGETYSIKVAAFGDGTNYSSSDYSPLTPVTTLGDDSLALATPSALRETAKTETTFTVAWDAVENASGYKIAWRNKADSANSYITLDASTTSYKLTGLDNAASYYWKVIALGDGDRFTNSDYTSARTVNPRQKLAAPTLSSAAEPTAVTVSWDEVPDALRYYVSYKLASATEWSKNYNVGTNLSYTLNGLEPNVEYNIRVKAIGDAFDYASSDYATITATPPAPNPIKLDAPTPSVTAKTATTIATAWEPVANATGYRFIWKNQSDSSYTVVLLDASTTSYEISGLDNSAIYVWKVLTLGDGAAYLNSEYSMTQRDKPQQTLAAPTATVSSSANSLTVSWRAVANADRYSVSYKRADETSWKNVDAGANLSYTVEGLAQNTEYDVRIKTIGDGVDFKNSGYSATVRAKTESTVVQLDAPIVSVVAAQDSLTVSWDAVPNAERYSLSYKLASETAWTNKNVGTNTSYTITGLDLNTEYDVRLKAIGDGELYKSVYSAVVRAKTDAVADPIKLDAPTPSVPAKTATTVTAAWSDVANASGYRFIWKNQSDSSYTVVLLDASTTSYEISGLDNSAVYVWKVLTLGDGSAYLNSEYCATQRDKPQQTLAAPTATVSSSANSLTVSWRAVANADRYSVSYKRADETSWKNVDAGANLSFTIEGLGQNTEYDVRIKTIGDGVDFKNSGYSATVRAKTEATVVQLDAPVVSVAATQDSLTVSWDAVPNAERYSLSYKLSSETAWRNKNVGTNTSYTVSGLESDAEFDFRVKAIGDGENYKSVYSAIVHAKTDAAPVQPVEPTQLATPTNLCETAKTETTVTVAWDAVENANGYKIAWRNKADSSNSYITLDASTTSYKLTGLDSAASYYWKVVALGDGSVYTNSAYTSARTVKPRQKLAAPTATASAAPSSITLSWNAVPNALRYYVSYKPANATEWSSNVNVGTKLSYTFDGLSVGARYDVRVKAIGDAFDYATSDFAIVETKTTGGLSVTPKPVPAVIVPSVLVISDGLIDEFGAELFDEFAEEDLDLLAANFRA